MKKFFALPLLISLSIFCSCQKQQTDAERQAEIDRQVQQRLDAEHQTQEKDQLAQRQAELDAREKALAAKENVTPPPREREARAPRIEPRVEPRTSRSEETRPTGSYDTFYTKLDSYGDWRETSDYGYVWQPREAQSRSWRPYTDGHWVYTDVGWTWVSEEPFGWATYHYGRWTRLRNVGWVWVPGDEWAPAWVSWRKSDDYVGWAPLPPEAHFDRRTGIHNWSDNYYDIGPEQYSFVETRQFGAPRLQGNFVPTERNVTIVNQTTNVTNITYNNTTVVNQGPSYEEMRTRTQQPIVRLRIERQVSVDLSVGAPQAVVRGEMVVIPAPLIARGQAVERPRRVKETVARVEVDRGWENVGDRQAAEKVRVKMQAEATPPPDAPSKVFVKPTQARAEATTTSATSTSPSATAVSATPAPTESATATVAPAASATITPVHRVAPVTAPTATVATTPIEAATSTPRPTIIPRPAVRSTSMPASSVSPAAAPSVSASAPMSPRHERPHLQPMATPSESAAGASPGASAAPNDFSKKERREIRKEERQTNKEDRRKERRGLEPAADESKASPSPTPAP